MDLAPIKSTRIYEEIVRQVKAMIADGKLKGGDRLPPERDLAEKFVVSRTSVREALRALESLGLVEIRPGEGTFIPEVSPRRISTKPRLSSARRDRKSTRLNSSHGYISYAGFCLTKKNVTATPL